MSQKTIAIIGASTDRNKFGNKAVRAFRQQGYQVFPVNPKEETVEGLRGVQVHCRSAGAAANGQRLSAAGGFVESVAGHCRERL
jgi:hypothetical protein